MSIKEITKQAEETLLKHSEFVQSVEDWTKLEGEELIKYGEEFHAYMTLNVDFSAYQPDVYVHLGTLASAVKYGIESAVREELFWFKQHKESVIYK